jgi:hypothetical protein
MRKMTDVYREEMQIIIRHLENKSTNEIPWIIRDGFLDWMRFFQNIDEFTLLSDSEDKRGIHNG